MSPHDTRLTRIAQLTDDWELDAESSRSQKGNPSEPEKDFSGYLAVILKRKWLILSLALIATTAATLYVLSLPPKYEALTTLRVQQRAFTFMEGGRGVVLESTDNYDYVNTQITLLSNPQLIRQVVARLDLRNNPQFLSEQSQNGFSSTVRRLFSRTKPAPTTSPSASPWKSADESATNETFTIEQTRQMEPYVRTILASYKVEKEEYTNLIHVRFTHTDPELAMKVVSTVADLFVAQDSRYENAGTRKAIETVAQQVASLETEINITEAKRLAYMKTHNLPLSDAKGRNLTSERVGTLSEQLLAAENDRKNLEAAYQTAMQAKDIFSIAQVRDSKDVQETQKAIRDLEQRRASLAETYTPEWPEVKKIESELRKVRSHLDDEARQALQSLKTSLMGAVAREAKLRAAYNQEQGVANTQSQDEIELTNLNQRLETSKQMHTMLLQRQKEIEINALNKSDMVTIVTSASVPTVPVGSAGWRTVVFAFVLSVIAGIALAFLLDFLDTKLHSVEDIARHAQLVSLAIIPSLPSGQRSSLWRRLLKGKTEHAPLALTEDLRSPTAEAYRQLRTSLLFSPYGAAPKSLLVTSSRPLEGKTTTAIGLAITLAQSGSDVLLIDCDLRRPKLHSHFNLSNTSGLTTFLSGEADIESLVQSCAAQPKLKVLTSGPLPRNPADLLGSTEMRDLLNTSRDFGYVILDSPPATGFADSGILSTLVDGVVIVVHSEHISRAALQRVKQRLQELGARVYGVVLNHADAAYFEGYYGDYYGYDQHDQEKPASNSNQAVVG
ncbi:MAG: polysaccharide biosynthesis tyrosine autokinase [Acidobacteriota bacterium]